MHSIPFPKTECTVSALLFRSMEIEELDELAGILSGKLDHLPIRKRNGTDANRILSVNSREGEAYAPTFSDSSRFEIDARQGERGGESERFFNVSETGSDTERSKPRGKRTASGFLLPFTEEHSRRSQDGVVRAGIREKGGRKTYPRSTFDKK